MGIKLHFNIRTEFTKVFGVTLSIDIVVQSIGSLLLCPPNPLKLTLPKHKDVSSAITLKYHDIFLKHVGSLKSSPNLCLFVDEFLKGVLRECGRTRNPIPDAQFKVCTLFML
jgi:hypothetical protein